MGFNMTHQWIFKNPMQSFMGFQTDPMHVNVKLYNYNIIEICTTFPRVSFVGLK